MTSSKLEGAESLVPEPKTTALSDLDQRIISFEQSSPAHSGAKEDAIRAEFGLTSARYYQLLNALIDSPAAITYDPMLMRRLHRVREAKMSTRTMREAIDTGTSGSAVTD